MGDFVDTDNNHKVQMHRVLAEQGKRDWLKTAKSRIKQQFKRKKINPNTLRVCEVGAKLKNKSCKVSAYRRVYTRYGNKWTCDHCALTISKQNEESWIFHDRKIRGALELS